MKRQHTEWEKIFAKCVSGKEVFKICKKLKQFTAKTNKQTNNPILKWAKNLNRYFYKEDTQRSTGT